MWNGKGNSVVNMAMRHFSSSSRKRAPNLRKINPRVTFQEAAFIAEDLYGVIKAHGPLSIGNAWNHAKGRSMLKQICNRVGSSKKFLLTTLPEEPQGNQPNNTPEPEPKTRRPPRAEKRRAR